MLIFIGKKPPTVLRMFTLPLKIWRYMTTRREDFSVWPYTAIKLVSCLGRNKSDWWTCKCKVKSEIKKRKEMSRKRIGVCKKLSRNYWTRWTAIVVRRRSRTEFLETQVAGWQKTSRKAVRIPFSPEPANTIDSDSIVIGRSGCRPLQFGRRAFVVWSRNLELSASTDSHYRLAPVIPTITEVAYLFREALNIAPAIKKPSITAIYPAVSLVSLALLMLLKQTYSVPFCVIHPMLSII